MYLILQNPKNGTSVLAKLKQPSKNSCKFDLLIYAVFLLCILVSLHAFDEFTLKKTDTGKKGGRGISP